MKSLRYIFFAWAVLCSAGIMRGDVSEVKSAKNFHRLLSKRSLIVALFYQQDKSMRKDQNYRRRFESLERMVRRVASQERYREAQVLFVLINTARGDLSELASDYGVGTMPAFMLFKEGRLVRNAQAKGFITDYQLQSFIDEYMGHTINSFVQARAARKMRRSTSGGVYTSFGIGYGGYPYGGYYGYPYYGGGVGFGVGF